VHGYGGLVFHDVVSRRHAEKGRPRAGVDGLVLVCGGRGRWRTWPARQNPFAFRIGDFAIFFGGTIVLAGGISTRGRHVAAAAGGSGPPILAYMGTPPFCCDNRKSLADPEYKQLILDSGVQDVDLPRPQLSGVPANFLLRGFAGAVPGLLRDWPGAVARCEVPMESVKNRAASRSPGRIYGRPAHGVGAISDVPKVAGFWFARMTSEYRGAISPRHLIRRRNLNEKPSTKVTAPRPSYGSMPNITTARFSARVRPVGDSGRDCTDRPAVGE